MSKPVSDKHHRFSPQIIAHVVWLYFRFPLSLRLVEEMLLVRGVVVSYETELASTYAGRSYLGYHTQLQALKSRRLLQTKKAPETSDTRSVDDAERGIMDGTDGAILDRVHCLLTALPINRGWTGPLRRTSW